MLYLGIGGWSREAWQRAQACLSASASSSEVLGIRFASSTVTTSGYGNSELILSFE